VKAHPLTGPKNQTGSGWAACGHETYCRHFKILATIVLLQSGLLTSVLLGAFGLVRLGEGMEWDD
jgi:hypothetical protein